MMFGSNGRSASRIVSVTAATAIVAGAVLGGAGVASAGTVTAVNGIQRTALGTAIKVTRTPKEFGSCQDAVDWLNRGAEAGSAAPNFTPNKTLIVFVKAGSGWVASATVSWAFDDQGSEITMTIPHWPNMTAQDKAAVQKYDSALFGHENGHFTTDRKFMAGAAKKLSARGATKDEAEANLETTANNYSAKVQEGLDAADKAYDDKTHHGRTQSAVGGQNVELTCSGLADVGVTGKVDALHRGGTATYAVTVKNDGRSTAEKIAISGRLPTGLSGVRVTGLPGCTISGGALTGCVIGKLASHKTIALRITVKVAKSAKGRLTYVISAKAANADPKKHHNTVRIVATVQK